MRGHGMVTLIRRLQPIQEIDRAAHMRNHDAAADHQPDRKRFEHFLPPDAGLSALDKVIGNAIVAAQHQGSDQAEQLLGSDI